MNLLRQKKKKRKEWESCARHRIQYKHTFENFQTQPNELVWVRLSVVHVGIDFESQTVFYLCCTNGNLHCMSVATFSAQHLCPSNWCHSSVISYVKATAHMRPRDVSETFCLTYSIFGNLNFSTDHFSFKPANLFCTLDKAKRNQSEEKERNKNEKYGSH